MEYLILVLSMIFTGICAIPVILNFINFVINKIKSPNSNDEIQYLKSLITQLINKNKDLPFRSEHYIKMKSEIAKENIPSGFVKMKYYVQKSENPKLKLCEMESLSSAEKIDNSKGMSFNSLKKAINSINDNSIVIISPPGSGKTVSLRNIAINYAKQKLNHKSRLIPIYLDLKEYVAYNKNGSIKPFNEFLLESFTDLSYKEFLKYNIRTLLSQYELVFIFDGIDELPKINNEYEKRVQSIIDFIENNPTKKFILSCRELDYNKELPFRQILLKPFDNRQIKKLAKKQLNKKTTKVFLKDIKENYYFLDLCRNPFYLQLIIVYYSEREKLPENKAMLFYFFTNYILDNSRNRLNIEDSDYTFFKKHFYNVIDELGYYFHFIKRANTIKLSEYCNQLDDNTINKFVIKNTIKAGILKYRSYTDELSFNHNRFQEYFSSCSLVKKIESANISEISFPKDFYTGLWWRESWILISSLLKKPQIIIKKLYEFSKNIVHQNSILNKIFMLETLILGFDCMYTNNKFSDDNLYKNIRDKLLLAYRNGNILERVKILKTLKYEIYNPESKYHNETLRIFKGAINSKSNWISETAFFILSEENIRMPANKILTELFRFFYEGMLFNLFIPILKLSRRNLSNKLILIAYFILLIINIFFFVIVISILSFYIYYLIFKMQYSLSINCIQCILLLFSSFIGIIYYSFNYSNKFLKNIIFSAILSLLIINFIFTNFENDFFYFIRNISGLLSVIIYSNLLKKSNSKINSYYNEVFSYFLGSNLTLLFLSKNVFLYSIIFKSEIIGIPFISSALEPIRDFINSSFEFLHDNTLILGIFNTKTNESNWLGITVLIITIALIVSIVINQIVRIQNLLKNLKKIQKIIITYKNDPGQLITQVIQNTHKLITPSYINIYINEFKKSLNNVFSNRLHRIHILSSICDADINYNIKDELYKQIDIEEKNIRRTKNQLNI